MRKHYPRRRHVPVAAMERVEDRLLYATYIVTGGGDAAGTVTPGGAGTYEATTLRAAVNAANATPEADVVKISPSVGTVALAGGELVISSDLAVEGAGANVQTIDAGGTSRVFNVRPGVTASVSDVTLANGRSQFFGGGAVRNEGYLTLRRVTVRNSSVGLADGGGVFNVGVLWVADSTFTGNTASAGGGLFNGGAATVVNSTFAGNTADFGGGMYNRDGALLHVVNSTVSGNRANQRGGGIASPLNDPSTTAPGGWLDNTIVAGNSFDPAFTESAADPRGPDLYGFYDPRSTNNLVGSIGWAKGLSAGNNLLGSIENATPRIDPLLSPLGYYGGTTQTMPPLPGSPAIDAGSTPLVPAGVTNDQRGQPRVAGRAVDIGSVETVVAQPPPDDDDDKKDKKDKEKKDRDRERRRKRNRNRNR